MVCSMSAPSPNNNRTPIPEPLGDTLGANLTGWTSLFTLPASLAASTIFSEAMWQRVWASEDKRTLRLGACLGAVVTTLIVFLSGFGGWLAIAAGRVTENTNPNLYLMQVRYGHVGGWVVRGVEPATRRACMTAAA
jgi:Na+/proline symporter